MHMRLGESPPAPGAPAPKTVPQVGSSVGSSFFQTIGSAFNSLVTNAPAILQVVNQQKLANINIQRARQGLAPIDYSQVPGLVPTYNVQGGLDQGTQQTVLMLGGLAVGAFVLMSLTKRHRRA